MMEEKQERVVFCPPPAGKIGLNKMKDNLGQECVKERFLSFQCKIGRIAPDFIRKMTAFPALTLLFRLSLPKIWLSHPNKNYIFEMSNIRAIH